MTIRARKMNLREIGGARRSSPEMSIGPEGEALMAGEGKSVLCDMGDPKG